MAFVPKYTCLSTEEQKKKAEAIRFKQTEYLQATKFTEVAKNWKQEANATFYESVAKYQPKASSLSGSIVRKTASTVESAVSKDDMGGATVGGIIRTGVAVADTYKAAKNVVAFSASVPHRITEFGKSTAAIYRDVRGSASSVVKTIRTTADSYNAVHGYVAKTKFVAKTVQKAAEYGAKRGVNAVGRSIVHGTVQGAVKAKRIYIPKAVDAATLGVGNVLASSDDAMVNATGKTITTTTYAVKTTAAGVRKTGSVIKTSARAGVKTAKAGKKVVRSIRKDGVKKTAKKAAKKAGESIVSFIISTAKAVGSKYIVPIVIVVVAVVVALTTISAPLMVIGTWLSGVFDMQNEDGTSTEKEVQSYVNEVVTELRQKYIDEKSWIAEYKTLYEGYHAARVKFVGISKNFFEYTSFNSKFFSADSITSTIQPIFNAVVLMDYELEPTEQEAKSVVENMFNKLIYYTEETVTENCIGVMSPCGRLHKGEDCLNPQVEYHDTYTCSCDSYVCHGHIREIITEICDGHNRDAIMCNGHLYGNAAMGTSYMYYHNDGELIYDTDEAWSMCNNYQGFVVGPFYCNEYDLPYCDNKREERTEETIYCTDNQIACDNCTLTCTGHEYCDGHKIYEMTVSMDGLNALIAKYFNEPIDELSSKDTLTPDEEKRLQNLKDYYEIMLIMLEQMGDTTGMNSLSLSGLKKVDFAESQRTGSQVVANLAVSQIGQFGGDAYWQYCGCSSRIPWSECFVYWIMNRTGNGDKYAYDIYERGDCNAIEDWFYAVGKIKDKTWRDMTKGDIAFLDSNLDGSTDKMGIVLGRDDAHVYVVEGNNADMVRLMRYPLDSQTIVVYAAIDY